MDKFGTTAKGGTTLLLLFAVAVLTGFHSAVDCAPARAMFIFGDSLVDNGNNNYIPSVARANYYPYGIDYGMPTGRFCNGLTVTDYAAKRLGLPSPPPYLSLQAKSSLIMNGVNYASAAAGILDETGRHYGSRVGFNWQIAMFAKTVAQDLPLLMTYPGSISELLSNSIFIINIGSNDYINNYLLPGLYTSSEHYSGEAFADLLISNLVQQLTTLHGIGARKMVLVGMGPLGCIPSQLSKNPRANGCDDRINGMVTAFNCRLQSAMAGLNATLQGSFFVYENIYDTFYDMIRNPSKYGFRVTNQACCGSGRYGGQLTCLPLQTPCSAREQYVFWDSFHPTQAVNAIIADMCYSQTGKGRDCYPISAYQLAMM